MGKHSMEKTSRAIKRQLAEGEIPLVELGEIFNELTGVIIKRLGEQNLDNDTVKAYSDTVEEAGKIFLEHLGRLPFYADRKNFSITLQDNKWLQLYKKGKSGNRFWTHHYLDENGKHHAQPLGSDTAEVRDAIEKVFNIEFKKVARFLPPSRKAIRQRKSPIFEML